MNTPMTREEKALAVVEGLQGNRWCIRCNHCLSIAFVPVNPDADRLGRTNWTCSLCKGPIECMGKVEYDQLKQHVEESVCDARCTNARGPKCTCHCHCANHGSKRTVTVTYDRGEAPEVNMPPSDVALTIANEFILARDTVAKIASDLRHLRSTGQSLSWERYQFMDRAEIVVKKAKAAKNHPSRMKALATVIDAHRAQLAA